MEQDNLFSQYVNSVKYNAISCDYIRQLFLERIWTQLLSQMLEKRKRMRMRRGEEMRGDSYGTSHSCNPKICLSQTSHMQNVWVWMLFIVSVLIYKNASLLKKMPFLISKWMCVSIPKCVCVCLCVCVRVCTCTSVWVIDPMERGHFWNVRSIRFKLRLR